MRALNRLFNPGANCLQRGNSRSQRLGSASISLRAFLLRDDHGHHHQNGQVRHDGDHEHEHGRRGEQHRDHNLRAAFVHVLADAAVSVLVIIGLVAGRQFGWIWMDPVMGLVATIVIMNWSWSLIRTAGAVLLDASPDPTLPAKIAARLEKEGDRISDLHLWRLGPGHIAAIISLVSDHPESPGSYKKRLSDCERPLSPHNRGRALSQRP